MYKRIMVAIDGSDTASRGLQEAIKLAKEQQAKLAIIHVIDLVIVYGAGQFPGAYVGATRELAHETLERARKSAIAAGLDPEIQSPEIVTSGYHVAETIAQAARDWKADLLVVGTHGRRGVSRWLLGSVAERIVRVAPCPLLLIRDHTPSGGVTYQRIMVAVDGSDTAQRGLQEAINFAKDQKAQLAIVHVIDIVVVDGAEEFSEKYIDSMRDYARETIEQARKTVQAAGIEAQVQSPEIVTTAYHVADTIAKAVQDWKADLLVVGTHGRRGVNRLLLGSVAERVVRVAPCPLLLVRGQSAD
jgi:nucleotide-binding universal stress UspA family protein